MSELLLAPAKASRQQIRYTAQGIIDEPMTLAATTLQSGITSQRVYGMLVGLRTGDSVTGVLLRCSTAAAGTAATLARFGIADSTGKMLAVSNDLGAATNWTIGAPLFPFAAPYPVTANGGYYICFVVNGTWGVTQPQIAGQAFAAAGSAAPPAGGVTPFFNWDSQTDLPAVGSSLTLTTAALTRYMAPYGTAAP